MRKCLIIIPAFNAADTLPELLCRLSRFVDPTAILVVDDGSADGTADVAHRAGVGVLRHEVNKGKGAALRTGFERFCSNNTFDSVITIDADLQHTPEELPKFLEARSKGSGNIIIGQRMRIGTSMPFHRVLSNAITSGLVSARTGRAIKDSQSGYRLLGREVLEAIHLDTDGYEAETELVVKAALKGFSIEFVPVATVYGRERSHMTHWTTVKRFLQVLLKDY
ncbi:MAG: glycosyltransferase family 2 protein [Ignavibacteria bacterium]|nr:glycosyltransferase family 2 protein [Ignavibacteria bacterium]